MNKYLDPNNSISDNLSNAFSPEVFGLSSKIATINSASIETHFDFKVKISDVLSIDFAGHAKDFYSDGLWRGSDSSPSNVLARAHVNIDTHREYDAIFNWLKIDIYDVDFLNETEEYALDRKAEEGWYITDPSFIFDSHSVNNRDIEHRPIQYMKWLSQNISDRSLDLSEIRVLCDETVFDGYGKLLGSPVRFDLNSGSGDSLADILDRSTLEDMIDSDILLGRSPGAGNSRRKLKLKRMLDNVPMRHADGQVAILHTKEDQQLALENIGISDLPPFIPVFATDKHDAYKREILEIVMARHDIIPTYKSEPART